MAARTTTLRFVCSEKCSEAVLKFDSYIHVPNVGDRIHLKNIHVFKSKIEPS